MSPGDLVLTPAGLRVGRRVLPCVIGRGGVRADKREGDGATPAGVHRIAAMLHRADRVAAPAPWSRPIGPGDLWCDDPAHPAYNALVRAPLAASAERMARADPLYDVVLVTDWNLRGPVPGRGSAIFVHRWRRPGAPTEGCVAMAARDLAWLAARIAPGARLVVPDLQGGRASTVVPDHQGGRAAQVVPDLKGAGASTVGPAR